jgi:inner membrane protein
MEPVTHFLTGACLGRSGFNRKTAYATLAMTLAAEAPDIDILWGFRGPVAELQHHRGITHTLIAAPFMACATVLFIFLLDRLLARLGKKRGAQQPPLRWGWLWCGALLADLSHLLLDFTNSYGLRPFFPFDKHWYAANIVFIFDPLLFFALLAALLLPALFSLTDQEIGARRKPFPSRGWSLAALTFVVILWGVRNAEHAHALALLRNGSYMTDPIVRVAAEPHMLDPFAWDGLIDTGATYRTAAIDTLHDQIQLDPDPIFKPPVTPSVAAAKRCSLGQVYLDWSQWPIVEDLGHISVPGSGNGAPPPPPHDHTVEFRDLRFQSRASSPDHRPSGESQSGVSNAPLSGWVYISPTQQIDGMYMDGREQK